LLANSIHNYLSQSYKPSLHINSTENYAIFEKNNHFEEMIISNGLFNQIGALFLNDIYQYITGGSKNNKKYF